MSVAILINGVDQLAAGRIRNDGRSNSFTLTRGQRGVAQLVLVCRAGDSYATTVQMGWPVQINQIDPGPVTTVIYRGTIDTIDEKFYSPAGALFLSLTCVSLEQQFDTLTATPPIAYFNKTSGQIVTDLLNRAIAAGAPITAGTISTGITIPTLVLDGTRYSDVLTSLATQCGFVWYIRIADSKLMFCAPSTTAAPFTLTNSKNLWLNQQHPSTGDWVAYNKVRSNYRNRQSVRVNFSSFYDSNEVFSFAGSSYTLRTPISTGVAAYITTSTQSHATCHFSANPADGDTVTVNDAIYVFRTAINNQLLVEVKIGATTAASVQNLVDAINGNDAVRGLTFSWPTWESDACNADPPGTGSPPSATSFMLRVKWAGSAGNGTACTSSTGSITFKDDYGTAVTATADGTDGLTQQLVISTSGAGGNQNVTFTVGDTAISVNPALVTGQSLSIQYQRLGGDVITVENTAAVAARAAIEGGTGEYQQLLDDSQNTSAQGGYHEAYDILQQFIVFPQQFDFPTDNALLSPGQYLTVSLSLPTGAAALLNGNWVVQSVSATLLQGKSLAPGGSIRDFRFRYKVTVIDVAQVQTYINLFASLTPSGPDLSHRGGRKGEHGKHSPPPVLPVPPNVRRTKIPPATAPATNILGTPYTVQLPPGTKDHFVSVTVTAQVAPTTTDYIVDVLVSTDQGATWNTIFTAGVDTAHKPSVAVGQLQHTFIPTPTMTNPTGFVIPTVFDGNQLQISILQGDAATQAAGVEVSINTSLSTL